MEPQIVKEEMQTLIFSEQSTDINELLTALSKAQGQLKPAVFNRKNPHFKNQYADLTSMWDSCREALAAHGLSVIQSTRACDYILSKMEMVTTLGHSSGQYVRSVFPVHCEGLTPQKIGSAITYYRRYSFSAILGICSEEDDDGEIAEKPNVKRLDMLSSQECDEILRLADATGDGKAKIDTLLSRLKITQVSQIPKEKFSEIKAWLERM